MMRGSHWMVGLVCALGLGMGGGANAGMVQNGDFETGPNVGGSFTQLGSGSTSIPGWTVTGSSIDYIGTYWQAWDGVRSLDMAGTGAGGVRQSLATEAGQRYRVQFALAGNPVSGPAERTLRVSAAEQSAEFTFDITGKSVTNMGWEVYTWDFIASGVQTDLWFESLTGGAYGPALDGVSVTQVVPAPGAGLLLAGLATGWMGRRRKFRKV